MALRNRYSGRRYQQQDVNRSYDNPGYYDRDTTRQHDERDYDNRYRRAEEHYENNRYRNYDDDADEHRLESIYGGDTRNYGNANQGSFDREWWERMRNRVAGWFGSDKEMNRPDSRKYKGIGPKNYQRSEKRIFEDVCDLLMENDGIDAGDIEVQVQDNYVILSGTVYTRAEKRRAEDLAASVPGVWDVGNRLRVKQPNYMHR